MATVDDRIVSMAFDSTKFQTGVSGTLSSIDKLNASLKGVGKDTNFDQIDKSANKVTFFGLTNAIDKIKAKFGRGIPEAADAFNDIEKASGKVGLTGIGSAIDKIKGKLGFQGADRAFSQIERSSGKVTLSGLGKAIDGIGVKFGGLQVAAVAAFGTVVSKATVAGGNMVKSLTIAPVLGGMKEYELKLNSIQTILSNTKAAGTNLRDVNKTLAELNRYSDKTIYNFGQMAKNIGTFTAAGVDLKTATASIKGIANLAALSGSNADQAATAMYQLSQAISSGRVSLQDWNSVVNAGMGGSVFQRALAETAVAMGAIDESALKLTGKMKNVTIEGKSFRESIMAKPGEQSWLTKEVLTGTLKQFTGDMTEAELAAQGFSKTQIKAIREQARMAVDAATKVKSLTQLFDTAKETAESGWSDTWQLIFGDFEEAKKLFTGASNALNGFITHTSEMRNSVLKDWKALGGRKILIDGIKKAFEALGDVLDPVKKAFRDVFPAKTGKDLVGMTRSFRDFMEALKPSPETVENLRRIFRGFFSVLDIGKQILGGIWEAVKQVFGAMGEGSGNVLDFAGSIGDLITSLKDWLREGEKIKTFFSGLGTILAAPVKLIGSLTTALGGLFSGGDNGASDSLSGMAESLSPLEKAARVAGKAWQAFLEVLEEVQEVMQPTIDAIGDAFGDIGDTITKAFQNANFDGVFNVIQTALVGGIFLTLKRAIGGGLNIDFGGGVLGNLTGSLDTLNGSLKSIQTNIKANTMLQIGIAVGLLAASVTALSLIDPKRLGSAMTAVTVGLGQLMGAMALMSKMSAGGFAAATLMGSAGALVILAGALTLMTIPLLVMSQLSWGSIVKGLAGIGGLLLLLSIATKPLSAAGPGMIAAGLAISALAIGLTILGGAVKIFATMSWGDMAKGLVGVTSALAGIGIAMSLIPPSILLIGPGLIAVGIALAAIGGAVKIFASMDLGKLAKGIGGMAASLVVIGLAIGLMPPTLPLTAAGLILVGIAITGIAGAIALMGKMKISTLAKGIIAMGAALVVLAAGLTLMSGALPGSAALMAAAAAFAILVPVIGILGKMKWGTLLKGLGIMVLTIIALGAAGAAAGPGLLALGVAVGVLGLGMTLVAASVYLLTSALVKLAGEGAKGIGVTIAAFTALVAILPKIVIDFIKGLVEILGAIAKVAPEVTKSVAKIIISLLDVVIRAAPKMAKAAIALIGAILKVIRQKAPDFIDTGWKLFLALLKGFEKNVGKVVNTVSNIIIKFLRALTDRFPKLVDAGADALVAFLKGIANNIRRVVNAGGNIIAGFLRGVGDNLKKVIEAGAEIIIKVLKGIGNKIGDVVRAGGRIISKFIEGVGDAGAKIVTSGANAASKFVKAVAKGAVKMADAGATAVIDFLNGVAKVIRKREPEMIRAGFNIGQAVVQGMIDGIGSLLGELKDKAIDAAKSIPKGIADKLGIDSPSKVTYALGKNVVEGLANGISDSVPLASSSAKKLAGSVLDQINRTIVQLGPEQMRIVNDLGVSLGTEFFDGMLGIVRETNQVDEAFNTFGGNLATRIEETRVKIKTMQDKLAEDLRTTGIKTVAIFKKRNLAIKAEQTLLATLLEANTELGSGLNNHRNYLKALIVEFNNVTENLQKAEDALKEAQAARDTALAGFRDSYSTLPDIIKQDADGNPIDQLAAYQTALTAQIEATAKFRDTLDQLRAAGLDDTTYQKLLAEGVGSQEFADQLLAGGETAITAINELDAQLLAEATTLATNAANSLHQAGVDAAQGLVDGLKSKKSAIYKIMWDVADFMVKAIRKRLKIKSPSQVFGELGKLSMQGMAKGLTSSSKAVTDAVTGVSKDALSAMKKSMKTVSNLVTDYIDPNPTITPVLDLTNVQNGSNLLKSMMSADALNASASYGQAAAISSEQEAAKLAQEAVAAQAPIQFVQNNNSPESLSDIEIYRQTRNLLSQARPVLATT